MNIVSMHIKADNAHIFRLLRFSTGEIDQKYQENLRIQGAVYQLLEAWKQSLDEEATVGKLCTVLWENGNEECVIKLRNYYACKSNKSRFMTCCVRQCNGLPNNQNC